MNIKSRVAWALLAIAVLCGLFGQRAQAQVVTPFTIRFSTNDTGDIVIVGNTLMTCPASAASCIGAQTGIAAGATANDNYYNMVYVDVDNDPTTFNSSRANLSLPSGATVLWAGLYWGGDTTAGQGSNPAPNPSLRNQVRFETPATGGYVDLAGTLIGASTYNGDDYQAFFDVTAMVQAGGSGTYRVANVQAGTGTDHNAGWGLVVVYRDPSQPTRNLTVFDGFATVTTGNPNVTIDVSGFLAPHSGAVNTRIGVVVYEGDVGLVGDRMRLDGLDLSDALNPDSNFFNSSITQLGNRVTAKIPDYVNQLGFDIDTVDASGILLNRATSATINLTSSSDFYYPGVVTFVIDLHSPDLTLVKGVTDLNGGNVEPGDVLEYTVSVTNVGQDAATDVVLQDPIPAHTTYVAGSLEISAGANAGAKTDALGDDQAEYDVGNDRVVFRLGSGADGSVGGTLATGESTTASFRVQVNPGTVNGTIVGNQASANYNGETLGTAFAASSPPVSVTITAAPVLSATKVDTLFADNDGDGLPSPGDVLEYTITITNSGNQAATGVTFDDIPNANTTLVVGSVTSSQGTVISGNNPGHTNVAVDIGTIAEGSGVNIGFRATIDDPLPAGVTQVANQGLVGSNELPTLPTDDPDTPPIGDPTVTPVTTAPLLAATKTDLLFADNDGDSLPSPGDTLIYQITILNSGNTAASALTLADIPDPNTALVVGSVSTSHGTVTGGNNPGDTGASVDVGTLPGRGGSVSISFLVTIDDPLPAGVTQVANQGLVNSNGLPTLPTDDPDTPPIGDPTITLVTAAPLLAATKTDHLFADNDGDSLPSPGDTLLYRITILNYGNEAATGITLSDTPDPNTTLVVGSVSTSLGTVTGGNNPGDTSVSVDVGTLPGRGGNVNLSFLVIIDDPLPAGVTQVANQGLVNSNGLPTLPTDDPDTPPIGDPTVTPVTAAPLLAATKTDRLFADNDGDGLPSPGDTLLYQITILNSGNEAATAITLSDTPDPNTALVAGSVSTSLGTVTGGNNPGDTSVSVDVGTLPGRGGSVNVSFLVTIDDPLPAGVTQVANQGLVGSNGLPTLPTDDPDTPPIGDPTITLVTAAPLLAATKTDLLFADNDGDGLSSPGDTLLYRITILNYGNTAATGVTLADTPDPNTALVVGSVSTSQGAVTRGNSPGDTSVSVDVGSLPGRGGSVNISFLVTIDDPLPAGVTQVANQGLVGSNELPALPTDDPDTPPIGDPTITLVTAAPLLTATKADRLFADNDGDGLPSPGDTLLYRITILNYGNTAATGVTLSDTPDPNTALVVGSVSTSLGTVTGGNNPGDTSVSVDVGTLPGRGGSVNISFLVIIDDPLPAGVTQVANQGLVGSNELPTLPTDDPDTPPIGDPTVTPVYRSPGIGLSKTLVNNTAAHQGELVTFTLSITNTGHTTFTMIPMMDIYDAAYLRFARSVPAPDEVRHVPDTETGWVVWNNLVTQFTPLSPESTIEILVVMTATNVTSQTLNAALIEDAVDNYGNRLSAFATAPVAILRGVVAIELLYFRAESQGNLVTLSWKTVVEIDNYGFELHRNHLQDFSTATRIAFLPGQGTGIGQQYSYMDRDVVPGNRYWYWLVDIDAISGRTIHGPLEVWVHRLCRLHLPIILQNYGVEW